MTTTPEHEAVTATLTTLAGLVGCASVLIFPDDRRPDVLRCDPSRGLLFVGEAKHSERPTDVAARDRLRSYLAWICSHRGPRRSALLAVAFTCHDDAAAWCGAVLAMAADVGLGRPHVRTDQVDGSTSLVLFTWTADA